MGSKERRRSSSGRTDGRTDDDVSHTAAAIFRAKLAPSPYGGRSWSLGGAGEPKSLQFRLTLGTEMKDIRRRVAPLNGLRKRLGEIRPSSPCERRREVATTSSSLRQTTSARITTTATTATSACQMAVGAAREFHLWSPPSSPSSPPQPL